MPRMAVRLYFPGRPARGSLTRFAPPANTSPQREPQAIPDIAVTVGLLRPAGTGRPATDRQVRTHPGQAQGGRPADTAAGAGDQHGPASHRPAVELSHRLRCVVCAVPAPQTVMTILPRMLPASSACSGGGATARASRP